MHDAALIVYHKHPVSARTRFLRSDEGCLFTATDVGGEGTVTHPGALLRHVADRLGIGTAEIKLDEESPGKLTHGEHDAPVYLAHLSAIDPPFEAAKEAGCHFISILEARDLPDSELLLLGMAYQAVLGG